MTTNDDDLIEELDLYIKSHWGGSSPLTQEEIDYLFELHQSKGLDYLNDYVNKKNTPSVCECGSEKIKSPRHSHWCPKYSQK